MTFSEAFRLILADPPSRSLQNAIPYEFKLDTLQSRHGYLLQEALAHDRVNLTRW